MASSIIGVLGYGGAVGRAACDILRHSATIRGGQRSAASGEQKDQFETMQVDIHDAASLARFCEGCDVVVNCAGASYLAGDIVALASMEAGAAYVDAFGADALERKLIANGNDKKGKFIVGAGAFPGLSALLPRWLCGQGFDSVEFVSGYAGGREYCSWGAGADLLLSAVDGFGTPDGFWRNGGIVKADNDPSVARTVPGFGEEIYVQPFINSEMEKLARTYGVHEAHWNAIFCDEKTMHSVSRGCSHLMESGVECLDETVDELMRTASVCMIGRRPWYTMAVEVKGTSNGKAVGKHAVLKSDNCYDLSGIVSAEAAMLLAEKKLDNGVYWAFEVVDPSGVVARIQSAPSVDSLTVVDIAETSGEPLVTSPGEHGSASMVTGTL